MKSKIYGNVGESLVFNYLKENKYKILKTNFTTKMGEIDIIAQEKDTLVFIEVKARNSLKFGLPREAVTNHKQNKIRMVATFYLKITNNFDKKCRFDVIEVLGENINHIKNAF